MKCWVSEGYNKGTKLGSKPRLGRTKTETKEQGTTCLFKEWNWKRNSGPEHLGKMSDCCRRTGDEDNHSEGQGRCDDLHWLQSCVCNAGQRSPLSPEIGLLGLDDEVQLMFSAGHQESLCGVVLRKVFCARWCTRGLLNGFWGRWSCCLSSR